jgi:hypothetical protein
VGSSLGADLRLVGSAVFFVITAGVFLRALWHGWARESALESKQITELTREGAAFLAKINKRVRRLEVQRAGERARARGIAQQQLRSLRFRVRELSLVLRAVREARAREIPPNDEQIRQLVDEQNPSAHRDRRIQELEAELAAAASAAEGKDREIEHLHWTLNDCRQV